MDEWKLGTVSERFEDLIQGTTAEKFVEVSKYVSEECRKCSYASLCRGGCRRWREPFVDGKPGLNQLCSAYRMFFAHTAERMERLGAYIRQKYAGSGK